MKTLDGKVAVVTGAGSGIGRGTALALADAGMHVVVADIDEESAQAVAVEIESAGRRSLPVRADVSDRSSVEALADAAWSAFGGAHVLHNNAGVAVFLPFDELSDADWRFTIGVNLEGVVNGIQVFIPRLREQGEEAHIVNTASMAGVLPTPNLSAYTATKCAVVGLSEALHEELAGTAIGVSVLCPGLVPTNLVATTLRTRPKGGAKMLLPNLDQAATDPGEEAAAPIPMRLVAPEDVGRLVRQGIEEDELFIFTHPEWEPMVRARFDRILSAFERSAR